jgi:hypothetical protein
MKARPYLRNPFKIAVLRTIRSTAVEAKIIRQAYDSLQAQDRDCLKHYVPRLLALEGR